MVKESCLHFVLVHGISHGAWCWYQVATLLRSDGHKVTVPDLAASGINLKRLDEVQSVHDYFQPLMEIMASLNPDERVIVVGHSFAGIGVSLAMEKYPEKILVAVFPTAVMPGLGGPPLAIIKEVGWKINITVEPRKVSTFFGRLDDPMDCQFTFDRGPENLPTSVTFGHKFMSSKVYQRCQPQVIKLSLPFQGINLILAACANEAMGAGSEPFIKWVSFHKCHGPKDLTLATMLVRMGSLFEEDISTENMLTVENYGSVSRVYIVCKDDELMEEDLQHWIIKNNPTDEVKTIEGSDHMVMLSKPKELCACLLEIAGKCA